jgi:hypothetical protein
VNADPAFGTHNKSISTGSLASQKDTKHEAEALTMSNSDLHRPRNLELDSVSAAGPCGNGVVSCLT